jgi:hypothetical protein
MLPAVSSIKDFSTFGGGISIEKEPETLITANSPRLEVEQKVE